MRHLAVSRNNFVVKVGGGDAYWHLMGRGQGCDLTSYNAQDSFPKPIIICSKVSIVSQLRNPVLEEENKSNSKSYAIY